MSLNSTATGRLSPPSRVASASSAIRLASCGVKKRSKLLRVSSLPLNALRELLVLDARRGDAGERDEILEIVLAEAVRRRHVVDVEHAEHAVFAADQRTADRRRICCMRIDWPPKRVSSPALSERIATLSCDDLARDRLRHGARLLAAALVARDLRYQLLSILAEQDRDAIDLENLIRVADDLVEQRIDVDGLAESLRDLEQRRELLLALVFAESDAAALGAVEMRGSLVPSAASALRIAHRQLPHDRRRRRGWPLPILVCRRGDAARR